MVSVSALKLPWHDIVRTPMRDHKDVLWAPFKSVHRDLQRLRILLLNKL